MPIVGNIGKKFKQKCVKVVTQEWLCEALCCLHLTAVDWLYWEQSSHSTVYSTNNVTVFNTTWEIKKKRRGKASHISAAWPSYLLLPIVLLYYTLMCIYPSVHANSIHICTPCIIYKCSVIRLHIYRPSLVHMSVPTYYLYTTWLDETIMPYTCS